MAEAPKLTFCCELPEGELGALFAAPGVIEDLQAMGAGVSLGLLDLSEGRAGVVRRLHQAGVPVIGWLLLPKEQGYWFNINNVAQAAARYEAFRAWTAANDLAWAGVALDVEPDVEEMAALMKEPARLLPTLLQRVFAGDERILHAEAAYDALVARIRQDGHRITSYQFPFVLDERRAGSTLLRRLAGLVDLSVDQEVLMIYTSFLRAFGPPLLDSYAREAQTVAVGSTGGGVQLEGAPEIEPLAWDELARDLRLAWRWRRDIHVFSLEGCVQQGFLGRLKDFQWDAPVAVPEGAEEAETFRRVLRAGLWASKHPLWVIAGLAGLLWALSRLRRLRR